MSAGVRLIADIPYAPDHGRRGVGDLYLPREPVGCPVALCIHGGGWSHMDKSSWAGVARLLCREGLTAFNINYRLLDTAPWPACGDDCVAAARFLLRAGHPATVPLDRERGLVVIGGSAGGHLAMWTGLTLPAGSVRAIVSVAGPGDLLLRARSAGTAFFHRFFGTEGKISDEMLLAASPITRVGPGSPPLLCVHSTNDRLVPIEQAKRMVDAYVEAGCHAELHAYAGPGEQHGIWLEGTDPHRLLPHIEDAVRRFLARV